jgi:NADP-dependent 3-hydroxy acid dehydrogenase YdfG
MLQAFLPNMIEKNHGHIVALSSILAFLTGENGTSYCSTKAGVAGIT